MEREALPPRMSAQPQYHPDSPSLRVIGCGEVIMRPLQGWMVSTRGGGCLKSPPFLLFSILNSQTNSSLFYTLLPRLPDVNQHTRNNNNTVIPIGLESNLLQLQWVTQEKCRLLPRGPGPLHHLFLWGILSLLQGPSLHHLSPERGLPLPHHQF